MAEKALAEEQAANAELKAKELEIKVEVLAPNTGLSIADIKLKHSISAQTFYPWIEKYGGLEVSEARRLKRLEDENRKLKQVLADLTLDNSVRKAALKHDAGNSTSVLIGRLSDKRDYKKQLHHLNVDVAVQV